MSHAVGLIPSQTEIGHAVSGGGLTMLAVTTIWRYVDSRIKLKSDATESAIGRVVAEVRPLIESSLAEALPSVFAQNSETSPAE